MRRKILATALISCALVATPVAANATEQPDYVLAAWKATEGDIWNPAQTLAKSTSLAEPTLDALDDALPCGGFYQIDLYSASAATDALLAGGVLYGPSNPTEDLAHCAVDGNPWKFYKTTDCIPEPPMTPFSDAGETFTCDYWTHWTRTGYYEHTFDAVANVWTEAAEPTIDKETSERIPTTYEERVARGCEPELAETGVNDNAWLFAGGGLLLLVAGVSLVAYRNRQKGATEHEQ